MFDGPDFDERDIDEDITFDDLNDDFEDGESEIPIWDCVDLSPREGVVTHKPVGCLPPVKAVTAGGGTYQIRRKTI